MVVFNVIYINLIRPLFIECINIECFVTIFSKVEFAIECPILLHFATICITCVWIVNVIWQDVWRWFSKVDYIAINVSNIETFKNKTSKCTICKNFCIINRNNTIVKLNVLVIFNSWRCNFVICIITVWISNFVANNVVEIQSVDNFFINSIAIKVFNNTISLTISKDKWSAVFNPVLIVCISFISASCKVINCTIVLVCISKYIACINRIWWLGVWSITYCNWISCECCCICTSKFNSWNVPAKPFVTLEYHCRNRVQTESCVICVKFNIINSNCSSIVDSVVKSSNVVV